MEKSASIRCRVAACRETLDDGKEWSFYLINDGDASLDRVELYAVGYEWGDLFSRKDADIRVDNLAPGMQALIWREDSAGVELRVDLSLRAWSCGREVRLHLEFPKLSLTRNLQLVDGLGKPGWQVAAEG